MARIVETIMGDAMDRAADEAISELDNEAQSEGEEFEQDDAAVDEGDGEALEAADEQFSEDDSEADDEEPADDGETESPVEFSWDGNPDTVPEDLKPYFNHVYDVMRKGVDVWMSKKATEWQHQRQTYEQRLNELESQARQERQKAITPSEPAEPGEDATAQEWRNYYRDMARYEAWQIAEQREMLNPPASLEYKRQVEFQQEALRRVNMIEQQQGYTEAIGEKMVEIAQGNPFWASQVNSDEGLMELFNMVKTQVESAANREAAAKAKSAELQRKAKAVQRKVSKPKTVQKKVTPARNFADMGFEDKIDAAIADAFSEFG